MIHMAHYEDDASPAPTMLTIEINYQPKPVEKVNPDWYKYNGILAALQDLMYQYDGDHQKVLLTSDGEIQELEARGSIANLDKDLVNVYLTAARTLLMKACRCWASCVLMECFAFWSWLCRKLVCW